MRLRVEEGENEEKKSKKFGCLDIGKVSGFEWKDSR